MSHPTSRHEWIAAAIAFAVLAGGVVLLSQLGDPQGRTGWDLLARVAGAALLGVVVASMWWSISWLGDHGWRYGMPERPDKPAGGPPAH